MFADDTNISVHASNIPDLEPLLNEELGNIHQWLLSNRLSLNITKTEFMIMGSRQKFTANDDYPLEVTIDDKKIKRVDFSKSLGVTIDKNLNWEIHIQNVIKKVSSCIGALKRVRPYISTTTAIQIYKALILPHLNYCSVAWSGISQTLSEQLQKLQNRAARVITKNNYETPSSELLGNLGWNKLADERNKQKSLLMFKARHGLVPTYIQNLFHSKENKYDLRKNVNALQIPKPRTEYLKNSFAYSAAVLWNNLPTEAQEAKSVRQFKEKLKCIYTNDSHGPHVKQ
jgi:hypothetical protein